MKIQLMIEMVPTQNQKFRYFPDEHIADTFEKKRLSVLGIRGYIQDLVMRFKQGAGSLEFSVRVLGPNKKE